jgi:hypothetical protein
MMKEFSHGLGGRKVKYPWNQTLFKIFNSKGNKQPKVKGHEIFLTFVSKG